MDDQELIHRISQLVDEEHALERSGRELGPDELERVRSLEVQLDQCWDLLRRRRARRLAGEDPDEVAPRDPDTVEHYQQ
ncbi:MAG TPA: DUF2630 family protein [Acidimicrobiales bacterium]|jgi:hypothetical protein|nr:DUF2630 family protein [Acidimicrobiales bacterium]